MAFRKTIAPLRIGRGTWSLVGGGVVLALGVLAYGSAAESGRALGGLLVALGSGLVLVGFWKRLFNAIEQRLAEIQAGVFAQLPDPPAPEPSVMVPSKPKS